MCTSPYPALWNRIKLNKVPSFNEAPKPGYLIILLIQFEFLFVEQLVQVYRGCEMKKRVISVCADWSVVGISVRRLFILTSELSSANDKNQDWRRQNRRRSDLLFASDVLYWIPQGVCVYPRKKTGVPRSNWIFTNGKQFVPSGKANDKGKLAYHIFRYRRNV